uniref:Tc1-like transposase DDE domain-containing protein n=1 Tax=Phytophthora ramorum TaxID=164328 RepID=H3G944_PHYRM
MENTLALTAAHKAHRLEWAKHIVVTSKKDWLHIIFSDEKKFNLDGPDGLQSYWHDVRRPPRTTVRRQNGGGSVMVWGGFSAKGKTVLTGRQASAQYIYTASEFLLPYAHLNYGMDFVYQQDNASIHTSQKTKAFFEEQGVNVLDWPARSPDLNPIENLWALLDRKVYPNGRQHANVGDLTAAILAAWKNIDQATLTTLIDSMPRRCIEVIEKKGGKTHY